MTNREVERVVGSEVLGTELVLTIVCSQQFALVHMLSLGCRLRRVQCWWVALPLSVISELPLFENLMIKPVLTYQQQVLSMSFIFKMRKKI